MTNGGDLSRGVQPHCFLARNNVGDYVIKLAWRGHIGIECMGRADQGGISRDAGRLQQRRREGMLILAVAILITEYFTCGVRLIAPDSESNPDVAEVGAHEVINCAQLGGFISGILCKFSSLGLHISIRLNALLLQRSIPAAYLFLGLEGGELNIGCWERAGGRP